MSSHFSKCLAHWFRIIGSFLIHFSDTHLILNKSWHLGPWWCGQVVSLHAFHSNNPSSIHAEAYSFFPTNLCLKRSNKTRKWPILKKPTKAAILYLALSPRRAVSHRGLIFFFWSFDWMRQWSKLQVIRVNCRHCLVSRFYVSHCLNRPRRRRRRRRRRCRRRRYPTSYKSEI